MLGTPRRDFQLCASTNDEATKWARAGAAHGAIVVADAQSKGRGRNGRAWNSPAGCGLYFSLVVRMEMPFARVPLLTMATALGAARALDTFARGASVKWPNDILLNGKKIGGLLCEATARNESLDFAVIGVGLNIAHETEDLPARALYPATSLLLETNRRFERDDVLAAILHELPSLFDMVRDSPETLLAAWSLRDAALGSTVEIRGAESWRGVAHQVDGSGALEVRDSSGAIRRVVAGDVFVIERL